jgi:AcrR family transcriptional regulator
MSPRRARAVRGRAGEDPGTALREHLIDAVDELLAAKQVADITTRDIARTAGLSDGVLYNYFADKHDLVVAALVRRYAMLITRFDSGLPAPGTGIVEDNLKAYALASLDLVAGTLPAVSSLISETALLHRFIAAIHTEPFGPHRMRQPIADYLAAEQRLGRLGDFDVDAAVDLIIGPAIMLGATELMSGTPRAELAEEFERIVHTMLTGLDPR